MAKPARTQQDRESRERARVYLARQQFHDAQKRRRVRDNVLAGVVGGILILAVVGGQVAYFTAGPGVPEPTPTETSEPNTPLLPDVEQEPAPEPDETDTAP